MLYFETSILVPLILTERTSVRIHRFVRQQNPGELTTSHWTRAEFSSMLAREVRMGTYEAPAARQVDTQFESLIAATFTILLPTQTDFDTAKRFLQSYETGLRAGDALHLAIAKNNNAQAVYTLDNKMIQAGRILGLPVSSGIHLTGRR